MHVVETIKKFVISFQIQKGQLGMVKSEMGPKSSQEPDSKI